MPRPITSHWRLILPGCVSILIAMAENKNATFEHELNLLQKNEQVRARVEAMIGRLKAMEQGT